MRLRFHPTKRSGLVGLLAASATLLLLIAVFATPNHTALAAAATTVTENFAVGRSGDGSLIVYGGDVAGQCEIAATGTSNGRTSYKGGCNRSDAQLQDGSGPCTMTVAVTVISLQQANVVINYNGNPGFGTPCADQANSTVTGTVKVAATAPAADAGNPTGGTSVTCPTGYTAKGTSCTAVPDAQGNCPAGGKSDGAGGCTATALSTTSAATASQDICPVAANATFRWASCWLIDAMSSVLNLMNSLLTTLLTIDTGQIFGSGSGQTINNPGTPNNPTSSGFYSAWSIFRNVGIGVVVVAAVLMVMSEALNLQIVDALTVRRSLPKIAVVVFLITISWSLTYYLITASNRIGHGMADLIYSSFSSVNPGANGENAFSHILSSLLVAGGALAVFGFVGILSFAAALAVGIALVLFMLLLRQGIIIMAVIIAPLALACYTLPNTARFTKFWWDTFLKSLLAFPAMTAIIAICKIMALISQATN